MFNLLVWAVYGIFVGSIAKSIVPGEENFNLWKTIALGIVGSYCGGAVSYLLNFSPVFEASGIFMGVAGATISLIVYNKLSSDK